MRRDGRTVPARTLRPEHSPVPQTAQPVSATGETLCSFWGDPERCGLRLVKRKVSAEATLLPGRVHAAGAVPSLPRHLTQNLLSIWAGRASGSGSPPMPTILLSQLAWSCQARAPELRTYGREVPPVPVSHVTGTHKSPGYCSVCHASALAEILLPPCFSAAAASWKAFMSLWLPWVAKGINSHFPDSCSFNQLQVCGLSCSSALRLACWSLSPHWPCEGP